MFNQDNTVPIKPNLNPSIRDSDDKQTHVKPVGTPKSDKNFRRLLNQSNSEKKEVADDEEEGEIVDNKETPSLFELSAKHKLKSQSKQQDSNNSAMTSYNPDEIAEEEGLVQDNIQSSQHKKIQMKSSQLAQSNQQELNENSTIPPSKNNLTTATNQEATNQTELSEQAAQAQSILNQHVETSKQRVDVFTQLANNQAPIKSARHRSDVLSLETDATVLNSKEEKNRIKIRNANSFAQEHPNDLSTVNPGVAPIINADSINQGIALKQDVQQPRLLQDVIDQIVKNIQTIEAQGKIDTVVTLQYPPVLNGAQLTLTSFESAPKEFNIAFSNLSNEAKQLLDQRLSQDSLTLALENKGFVIHMITTNTLPEMALNAGNPDQQFARNEERRQQQQQNEQEEQAFEEET